MLHPGTVFLIFSSSLFHLTQIQGWWKNKQQRTFNRDVTSFHQRRKHRKTMNMTRFKCEDCGERFESHAHAWAHEDTGPHETNAPGPMEKNIDLEQE